MTDTASVNWPDFLKKHDMFFEELPVCWQEAPHFGNGMLGSMLYLREDKLCLEIFRADVCDHRDETYGWTAYSRPRLKIGFFTLETSGKPTGCSWRKDLWNAELTGRITTGKGEIKIRHFVHADDMAIVTELTPSEGESSCRWAWHPEKAWTSRPDYPTDSGQLKAYKDRYGEPSAELLKPLTPNPEGRLETRDSIDLWVQDLIAGGQYAAAWCETEAKGTITHLVSIAHSYPDLIASDTARADVKRYVGSDADEWIEKHREWWHEYYSKSYLTISDKGLESLYWQTIYRYGCTSRAGLSFVDTSGMWFQGGPWPYITTDYNIQTAHWGVYAANRLELGVEIVNILHERMDELVKAVRPVEWQEDSAYLPIAVAWDMIGSREDDMRYYHLLGNLPWTIHNMWMQYRYSMDDDMLRDKIFPLLRRAMNMYFHISEKNEEGKLHLQPTYSPETGIWKDANFDLALFKWGCLTLLKICRRLQIDDPLISRWRDAVENLTDFPADENGFMLGSEEPARAHHRHLSHLLLIYPLYLMNIDQAERLDLLKRSYYYACGGDGSDGSAECGPNQAMVQTHAVPLGAALGDAERALEGVKRQQADLLPNGLWACSNNPCIESTLSLANNIQEMLIQSWCDPALGVSGPIRIFPAVPESWKDIEFYDFRAEGAFLVSAKRTDGETEWIRIRSLAGEPCRIRIDLKNPQVNGNSRCSIKEIGPSLFDIDIIKGEEVTITGETSL